MTGYLAAFGAAVGDRRGYRWLWQDASLSEATLKQILSRLDTARFSDTGPLRRLLAGEFDAGVFTLPEGRCVAYRFLHGGRDGSREKFQLQIAVLPRQELPRLDLLALMRHPALSSVQETCPTTCSLELPLADGIPVANSPIADSVAHCWSECRLLPQARSFHLHLTGSVNAPLAESRVEPSPPSAFPAVETPQPAAVTANRTPSSASSLASQPAVRPQPNRKLPVTAFLLGLLVGLLLGRGCACSPKADDLDPRPFAPSIPQRPSVLDSHRKPTQAAPVPKAPVPIDSSGAKSQGVKPH